MSSGNSKVVTSSQTGVHERLAELVARYQATHSQRPIAEHTRSAFEETQQWLATRSSELILDAGCGTGESTARLAQRYPHARVIGLDRSIARLGKHQPIEAANYFLIRADLPDFLRLARQHNWRLAQLYLLYPNPYPKPTQVQRRWHASPAMGDLLTVSEQVEVRSNWRLYCEELAYVCAQYHWQTELSVVGPEHPLTPFERKYQASAQRCWRLQCQPQTADH